MVVVAMAAAAGGYFLASKLGSEDPITLDDRFHIGSNAKAMTGYLAAILVDRGQLTWETKISDVFPAWKTEMLPDYLSLTLRDVLSHRAGIRPFKHESEFERFPQWEGSDIERSYCARRDKGGNGKKRQALS